jgi:membrane-associated phospholipid phosphatase
MMAALMNRRLLQRLRPVATGIGGTRAWADTVASVVSAVLSPPVLAATMLALATRSAHLASAWFWASIWLTLSILAPIVYLLWLRRRGVVSDLDVTRRAERARPMLATLGGAAVALAVLRLGAAPQILLVISSAAFLQLLLVFPVTLRWKISIHATVVASFAVLMWGLIGPAAVPLAGLVPLIAWARIRLRRHTLAQTVAGTLCGSLTMIAALILCR